MGDEITAKGSTEQLKSIIAGNIADLRRAHKMTQLDLAEKLNYTDKAISKWERGESIPDVLVLKSIADLFGVTVDYLLEEVHTFQPFPGPYFHQNLLHHIHIIRQCFQLALFC